MKIRKDAILSIRNELDSWRRDVVRDISDIEEDQAEGIILREDDSMLELLRSELIILTAFYSVMDGIEKEGVQND